MMTCIEVMESVGGEGKGMEEKGKGKCFSTGENFFHAYGESGGSLWKDLRSLEDIERLIALSQKESSLLLGVMAPDWSLSVGAQTLKGWQAKANSQGGESLLIAFWVQTMGGAYDSIAGGLSPLLILEDFFPPPVAEKRKELLDNLCRAQRAEYVVMPPSFLA